MGAIDPLSRAIRRALREPPADLPAAMAALPAEPDLPSPWETWTLIGLVRHRRRQLWVTDVVSTRLAGDPEAFAERMAYGHPADLPQAGLVPGLTEWEYFFHGRGCCLTHRGTGERIDVDFYGPDGEYFDVDFYLHYLKSLQAPAAPEARLIALHPSFETVPLSVETLMREGLLTPLDDSRPHPFRLAEKVLDHEDAIDAFGEAWGDASRVPWLAAAIGDWIAAADAALHAGDPRLIEVTSGRAAACRAARTRDLLARWDDERLRGDVLLALDDLDSDALSGQLLEALRGPIGGATSRAVQVIRRRNDPSWSPALHEVFGRLDPAGDAPDPHLWGECLRFLFKHAFRTPELRRALSRGDGLAVGAAALLAMEYDPGRALPIFRRALRSHIPWSRTDAAAVLALIDRPWSRRELLAVLRTSTDQGATAECRAALRECHDREAEREVDAWEAANPYEPAPSFTMRDMILRDCHVWIRSRMEAFHERVMRIRDREPGEVDDAEPGPLRRAAAWISRTMRRLR